MNIIDIIIKACVAFLLLVFVICLVLTIAMVIGAAIKAVREERERRAAESRDAKREYVPWVDDR